MNTHTNINTLSQSEQKQLKEQGWILFPGVIPSSALAAMHKAWEVAEARTEATGNNWGPRDLQLEAAFAPCLTEEKILAALRVLLRGEPHLQNFQGRSPPQGLGLQGLHIDWKEALPEEEHFLANVFWLLDDVGAHNGATRIVPGSHRWRRLPKGQAAQPSGSHPDEKVIQANAGDVLVFSSHLWHSGTKNISGKRRRIAISQFTRQ